MFLVTIDYIKALPKKIMNLINYHQKLRKNPSKLKRNTDFNMVKGIHRTTESRIKEYRKRLRHYISDLESGDPPFTSWEELNFCLINPLKNVGETKPQTFGYLTNQHMGIIGYLEFFQEDPINELKGLPVLENPVYASFIHSKLSARYLTEFFRESQIENIRKKSKSSGAFHNKLSSEKAIEVLERESQRILHTSNDDCVFFGSLQVDISPESVVFIEDKEKLFPYHREDRSEILLDIRHFPDGNYDVIDSTWSRIKTVSLKNGNKINT